MGSEVRATPKSGVFVFLQFFFIGAVVFSGPFIASNWLLLLLELGGIVLAFWSIWVMRIGNFSISPEVISAGRFVTRGPYRMLRHPMYTSVLLVCFALLLSDFTVMRVLYFVGLSATLCFKCNYEESLLIEHFPGYNDYMKGTWRIIPFVY